MILAGAGTGKTYTLMHRIRHLISTRQIDPQNTLLLTFTEKATNEAIDSIRQLLGKKAEKIFVGTFHSFCYSLIRRYGSQAQSGQALWQEVDSLYFLIENFNKMDFIQSRKFSNDPKKFIYESFLPFFNRSTDELLSPGDLKIKHQRVMQTKEWFLSNYPGINQNSVEIKDLPLQLSDLIMTYEFFQKAKEKYKALDYGDMVQSCYNILANNNDILYKVRKEFRHIFIDEYQDNNYALNKIINLIIENDPSITVVGDEDQCIYSFRGANYFNISDFRKRYGTFESYNEVTLIENRRSTQKILNLSNEVISKVLHRTKKELTSLPEKLNIGSKPKLIQADKSQTMTLLPELIQRIVIQQGVSFGDIAIICRGRGNVKDAANSLRDNAIPIDIHIEEFFEVSIIKDILAWAHVIIGDDKAESALFRILKNEVSANYASIFFQRTSRMKIDDRLALLTKNKDKINEIDHIIEVLINLKKDLNKRMRPDEMVWNILANLKSSKRVKGMRSEYEYEQKINLSNAGEILNLAEKFNNKNPDSRLDQWLKYMDVLFTFSKKPATQPELSNHNINRAVNIMTIHQSKGLQFPIVIIPFMYSGSFPSRLKKHPSIDRLPNSWKAWSQEPINPDFALSHLDEERRIFYVGITRAERELYIIGPTKRQSLFTKELDESSMKNVEIYKMKSDQNSKLYMDKKKQKLLMKMNNEIASNKFESAKQILFEIEGMNQNPERPNNQVQLKQDLLHLSSTKIETYDTCSYKYRLKYIDKLPERKTRATGEFGSIMHSVLEEFHGLDKREQTKVMLFELLEKNWRENSFEYRKREEEFRKQGEEILSHYFDYIIKNSPNVIGTEKSFSYTIDQINVKISGKIDRVDQEGDYVNIIDYKTSQKKEKAKNNLQMALYTEAMLNGAIKDIKASPSKATLHFLRHVDDPVSSHSFSDDELEESRKKISEVADGIRKQKYETKKSDFTCRFCDYKEFICPAWEQ